MIVHQVFAQIFDEKVQNVIVCDNYEMANWITRASYGDTAFAVDCLCYPCQPGNGYRNNSFYRIDEDGTECAIEAVASTEQEVANLNAQVAYLQMMSGMTEEVDDE